MTDTLQSHTLAALTPVLGNLHIFAHLPAWLARAADPKQVGDALRASIPEFISGSLSLQECRVSHLRISHDGTHWSGTYHCTIADPTIPMSRSVPLYGRVIPPHLPDRDTECMPVAFASKAWQWFIPELRMAFAMQPPETQLKGLSELTDPERARLLLQEWMKTGTYASSHLQIEACRPEVLRYHPGLRCTLGYHLSYHTNNVSTPNGPAFVVAKTYEDERGRTAYEAMHALWRSPLGASSTLAIAEPIAYIPERRLLLQGPLANEQNLQALLKSALLTQSAASMTQLQMYLRQTARGLAELHGSGVSTGIHHHWHDELANVQVFIERLTPAVPALVPAAQSVFAFLEQVGQAYPADPPVPCHGTFRPSQVLLHQGQIGFIDFDSFCQAEPAMDLALFMVALVDSGLSVFAPKQSSISNEALHHQRAERLAQLEAIAESFLSQYAALRPVSYARVGLWRALNTLEVVARSWDRVKPKRLHHTIPMLEQQLRRFASKERGAAG